MIPRISARELMDPSASGHSAALDGARLAATDVGFLVVEDTPLGVPLVKEVIKTYREFFALPAATKETVNMARTGSNRGWGAPGSEQVDPDANPDYKQFFDCGYEWAAPELPFYSSNLWPQEPARFKGVIQDYYARALPFALDLLCAVAGAAGEDPEFFRDKFDRPMALLRGNYYPERPSWAGEKDFGIATHTDYGCLTLLATDGTPGLEVRKRGGGWIPVTAEPGAFVINFGEMIEMWTERRIVATPHRVVGGSAERLSVPLFFNPQYDTNVAPIGSGEVIRAADHLASRFEETYVHLKDKD